jgi:hypothetical protein
MTEQETKAYLLQWVKDYCNDDFASGVPAGVTLFIELSYTKMNQNGIQTETLGDASFTYVNSDEFNKFAQPFLRPYRRIRTL